MPWAEGRDFAVGELARRQGAELPDRTVAAAKSWLCHSRVDRRQPILPWNAPAEVPKISPVTASQRYLEHLVAAWEAAHPDAPLAEQQVVLTVPASFDASARELTREAALAAGLPPDLVLLEEPQAAVYAWLATTGERWRRGLSVGDTLLVCDVGGGTTDLTLVGAAEEQGELVLRRIAVGNHLLVGGDNMDLALAHYVAGRFAEKGVELDPWQSVALWHSCRAAKETLLAARGPRDRTTISVLGRGRKLIGGTVSVEVDRRSVSELLVDGFFPRCQPTDRPVRQRASGFREMGLPFESDTAITRHLAASASARRRRASRRGRRTCSLTAGCSSPRRCGAGCWTCWASGSAASGAAAAGGLTRSGPCRCPRRGLLRLGEASRRHADPRRHRPGLLRRHRDGRPGRAGRAAALRALCVVPIGMEEGTETDVPSDEIGLVVGEPAHFRFFSSSVERTIAPATF